MSTSGSSSVPKLRFDVFDSVYRQLYKTLAITLMLDPKLSLHIMALWIWMEKSGFIDTVENIHNLPLDLISGLADEAVLCINFFENSIFPTPSELSNSIPLLHFLMKKELPLMFLPANRVSATHGMKKVHIDVSLDFEDLYREAKWTHETVKQKLVDEEMSQLTRSFNDNVNLDNTIVGSNLSPGSSGLSGSSRSGFGLGSSTLVQRGLSSSEPGPFNVAGRSKWWKSSTSRHLSSPPHNAANFEHDPIKVVLPGSPVSPHGYVGMGRFIASNRDVGGVIGQPRIALSNSFHYEPTPGTPRRPTLSSPGPLLNPAMRVGQCTSLAMAIPRVYPKHLLMRDTFVVVPAEDRTLFVTFSKGYQVHEPELKKYMTNWLGDCIEAIIMQETPRDEQPLYARIVFHYPETIDAILKGNERYKFSINGKHVWVRKYIPKNQRNKLNV